MDLVERSKKLILLLLKFWRFINETLAKTNCCRIGLL
jgi:hypothetical protein